jgi:ribosomal protein L7Ae-like RNA K-turn-binding protein
LENKSKAQTFVGFAIRAGKYRIGLNACQTLKHINLILICKTTAENTRKKALSLATKHRCQALITESFTLDEITHKSNAKVMAITDKALSKAILDNKENEFITPCKESM